MNRGSVKILALLLVLLIFPISGCQQIKRSFLNPDNMPGHEYEKMTRSYKVSENGSSSIQVQNGVIIYRDKSSARANSFKLGPESSSVNFGPRELRFGPKDVNPQ